MTDSELIGQLKSLSIEQLEVIRQNLTEKRKYKDRERERLKKLPPRNTDDLKALADMQELDLSSLLRDAKRYS